jgi:golgi apparatus protein 1
MDCIQEMLDHRKLLLEDYRMSPEIVSGCSDDIAKFCNSGIEAGGKTIHCLMEHSRVKKRRERISSQCQRAVSHSYIHIKNILTSYLSGRNANPRNGCR